MIENQRPCVLVLINNHSSTITNFISRLLYVVGYRVGVDRWVLLGRSAPLRPHSHPGRSCERGRLRCLRNTTTSTWLSALLPSVVVGPRRSAHGLLCSGYVYLSCSRSHDRGHLMPSLLSPSPFGAESTQSVGKRLPCSGWSLLPPRKARLTWTRVIHIDIRCLSCKFCKLD